MLDDAFEIDRIEPILFQDLTRMLNTRVIHEWFTVLDLDGESILKLFDGGDERIVMLQMPDGGFSMQTSLMAIGYHCRSVLGKCLLCAGRQRREEVGTIGPVGQLRDTDGHRPLNVVP